MNAIKLKAKGSFYIKQSNNKKKWFLYFQEYINGEKVQQPVPTLTYSEFGFKDSFTHSEAKARAKQLNGINKIEKIKIKNAANNLVRLQSLDLILFPENEVDEFQQKLEDENVGSKEHLSKLYSHFKFIQRMLKDTKLLEPQNYKSEQKKLYLYLAKKKVSLNYSKRLISLLNRWGRFQARLKGHFFEDVQPPRSQYAANISDSQKTKTGTNSEYGVRTESSPLTPQILKKIKKDISTEQYNWLYLSLWLGLRPSEVDSLHNKKNYKLEYNRLSKIDVIQIYQSKLKCPVPPIRTAMTRINPTKADRFKGV